MNKETPLQLHSIRLFAILLIAGGVGSIATSLCSLFVGSINIDLFGWLGILIGKGLLERKELWRKWALFVAWLGILGVAIMMVLFVGEIGEPTTKVGGIAFAFAPSRSLLVPALTGLLVFCFSQQWILTRPTVKESFSSGGEKNDWWLSIAIASFVLWGICAVQESVTRQLLRSIESYDTAIEAFDAKTGERLDPTIQTPAQHSNQIFPRTSSSFKGEGQRVEVSGIGIRPIEVVVSAEGYQEKKVPLGPGDRHTVLRVELEQAPNNGQP